MKKFSDLIKEVEGTLSYQEEKVKAEIAHQILIALKDMSLNQSELALAMGVKPSYVSRIVSASENLSLKSLVKLASALNKNLSVKFCNKAEEITSNEYKDRLLNSLERPKSALHGINLTDMDWSSGAANSESFHTMNFSEQDMLVA